VTIGHRCIIHGARIEDDVLVGMGAILMNGSVIGSGSVIGAGALITEGRVIPPRSLVVGMPAKVIRTVDDKQLEAIRHGAEHYVEAGRAFRAAGHAAAPAKSG
jgi:carbonic anhydrase/acetyltransferase-like protein (isoleucine patch superfamily)